MIELNIHDLIRKKSYKCHHCKRRIALSEYEIKQMKNLLIKFSKKNAVKPGIKNIIIPLYTPCQHLSEYGGEWQTMERFIPVRIPIK